MRPKQAKSPAPLIVPRACQKWPLNEETVHCWTDVSPPPPSYRFININPFFPNDCLLIQGPRNERSGAKGEPSREGTFLQQLAQILIPDILYGPLNTARSNP